MNVSLITYGAAASAFITLATLLLTQWRVRPLGVSLLLAVGATALWAGIIATGTLYEYPPVIAIQVAELIRDTAWIAFLLQLLGLQNREGTWRYRGYLWPPILALLFALSSGLLFTRHLGGSALIFGVSTADLNLLLWLGLAVAGLLLVEQLYRNAIGDERWGLKFLCLGLGVMYAYDLFMYAEALLFRQLSSELWQARGLVFALVVPWLAVAITRNKHWRLSLYVSRHVVFHTVTLAAAGLYLLCMALIGYFVKYMGGSWGGVLQVSFLALSGVLLLTVVFSANLRARLRVFLSKHFFSYRYDYREEWLRFTDGLASLDEDDIAEGILKAMAPISLSKGGCVVHRDTHGGFTAVDWWQLSPITVDALGNLPEWIAQKGWVIDLFERRRSSDLYAGLELPNWLEENEQLWLVVPLLFQNSLEGLLFLTRTELKNTVNWEDRDLLRTAGKQAAALLAQHRVNRALIEARQFDAFNRLSAYVIHDLKNILAQQSLMVANSRKHRDNPAFIDDMIGTVENSVNRMQRLMDQMRSGIRSAEPENIDLELLLADCVAARADQLPRPELAVKQNSIVAADRERLGTVFGHILQNAQEATPPDGAVTVQIEHEQSRGVVTIADNGSGMTEAFVREKLFKPFESTKGLTGMGIGAFESREYVRQLGGDLTVSSSPGDGSVFKIMLPCVHGDAGYDSFETNGL